MEFSLTCQYCAVFEKEESVTKNGTQYRKCKKIRKLVTYKRKICDQFSLANYIFCEAQGKFIRVKTCFENKEKQGRFEYRFCKGCMQYAEIIKATETDPEATQKKTLKRRPKLKRRTK